MTRIIRAAALIALGGMLYGQGNEMKPDLVKFYHLDFVVKEVEGGKVLSGRSYSLLVSNEQGPNASVRTGAKVPYNPNPNTVNYADIGVNIDCRGVRESGGNLSMNVSSDISSIAPPAEGVTGMTIRQNRWTSNVIVPLKKATIIFSSDDASGKRKMQLELTATPVG